MAAPNPAAHEPSEPGVGLDHPTVVPTNFEPEEGDEQSSQSS